MAYTLDVELLKAILLGLAAGVLAAFVGYMKQLYGPNPEPFDEVKFGDTLVLGAILGAIAGYFGITTVDAQNLLQAFGIYTVTVFFVNAAVIALIRYIRAHIQPPAA